MLLGFDIGGTKSAVILGNIKENDDLEITDKEVLPTNKPVYEMTCWQPVLCWRLRASHTHRGT